nr:hypothetical protein CFP56_12373 [Quercus suber]
MDPGHYSVMREPGAADHPVHVFAQQEEPYLNVGLRLYKSCRQCRTQKVRCVGSAPCQRCQRVGTTCVYEPVQGRKRRGDAESFMHQKELGTLTRKEPRHMATLHRPKDLQPTSVTQHSGEINEPPSTNPEPSPSPVYDALSIRLAHGDHLLPDDFQAPVTTVHIMMQPSPLGQAQRNRRGWTAENQSKWNRQDAQDKALYKDVLERSPLDQAGARGLFDSFMSGANAFLRIFTSGLDTFDSIRAQSSFVFTVIMYIAARQHPSSSLISGFSELCLKESRQFAAHTLFENPASLEAAEAMTTLAVYSPKSWFALGHAFQMAVDLRLKQSMMRIISESSSPISQSKCTRYDSRCARTWLMTTYYERSLAVGGDRDSRTDTIELADMELYLSHGLSGPADISFCAGIDLFQRCGQLQQHKIALSLEEVEEDLESWWELWSSRFEDHYVQAHSFQRVHLRIMMLYVRVFEVGILASRTAVVTNTDQASSKCYQLDQTVSKHCLKVIDDLLTYVNQCEAYKQVFRWSPNFEALLLTYCIVLGFRLLNHPPDMEQRPRFLSKAGKAAELLNQHPCQKFYKVVDTLLKFAKANPEPQVPWPDLADFGDSTTSSSTDFFSTWQNDEWAFNSFSDGFLDMS